MDWRNAVFPVARVGQPVAFREGRASWAGDELLLVNAAFGDVSGDARLDAVLSIRRVSGVGGLRMVVLEGSPAKLAVHLVHEFARFDFDMAERVFVDGKHLVVQGQARLPGEGCIPTLVPYTSRYVIRRGRLVRVAREGPTLPPQTCPEKRKATPTAPPSGVRRRRVDDLGLGDRRE